VQWQAHGCIVILNQNCLIDFEIGSKARFNKDLYFEDGAAFLSLRCRFNLNDFFHCVKLTPGDVDEIKIKKKHFLM
jgi:hypothetical protein